MPRLSTSVWAFLILFASCIGAHAAESFPPLYERVLLFLSAIDRQKSAVLPQEITGITVPHHLLAVDLIADAFARISGGEYRRIVILSPDHFRRGTTAFSVTRKDFRTVLGTVNTDRPAVEGLLANPLVSESELFSHEHGVQAILPFVAHFFPDAKVVPVAIRLSAQPAEWDELARTLGPLLSPETLIVQSTDFSHFLTQTEAMKRDQETLRVLSATEPELITGLVEPDHLDSRAAQYLQLKLQRDVFHARPVVIANRNAQDYTREPLEKTTSYIVQLYSPDRLELTNADEYLFAGDTFFGRHMARLLADEERRGRLIEQVLRITRGKKLIVNLEGVVMERCPERLGPYELCMEAAVTLPLLKELNVAAVSLANNHRNDFGPEAYREMIRLLTDAGIVALENASLKDFSTFRLVALTDVDNSTGQKVRLLGSNDLAVLDGIGRDKPIFAFLHWGSEFTSQSGPREEMLSHKLHEKGVELIVGCHTHSGSELTCTSARCRVFSLGNFIFDQTRPAVSARLLSVSFLPQGTYFLRLEEMENPYGTSRD